MANADEIRQRARAYLELAQKARGLLFPRTEEEIRICNTFSALSRTEGPWLAERLLEALDRNERQAVELECLGKEVMRLREQNAMMLEALEHIASVTGADTLELIGCPSIARAALRKVRGDGGEASCTPRCGLSLA